MLLFSRMLVYLAVDDTEPLAERVVRVASIEIDVRPIVAVAVRELRVRAWCAAVVEGHVTAGTTYRISRVREMAPTVPRLLIARKDEYSSHACPTLDVASIVWENEVDRKLRAEIRRVRAGGIRAQVGLVASLDRDLQPVARRALIAVARVSPPVTSVAALAAMMGVSRSALWRAWHEPRGATRCRLEDLLDWLLLVEAVGRKTAAVTWADVSAQVGVHEHTIARIAPRLHGHSVNDLVALPDLILSHIAVRAQLGRFLGRHLEAIAD